MAEPAQPKAWRGFVRSVQLRAWHVVLLVLVVLALDFALTSIWVVKQNEQGVVLRFGRVVQTRPAGMHFTLPYPVETMQRVQTTEVRTLPVGFTLVHQGSGAAPSENEVQWLTGDTNIVEMQAVIQYMIKDPVAYLFRVADFSDGRPKDFALRKIAESVLTSLVAQMSVDDVLASGKARLQEDSRQQIQELADTVQLGLQVVSVNMVQGNPPPDVIAAFNDVSSAKADRERLVSEADGYAKDLLPKARGQANRMLQEAEIYRSNVVNAAQGATQRFLKLAVEVQAAPEISKRRLWLEVVEKALSQAKIIVYSKKPGEKFTFTQVE